MDRTCPELDNTEEGYPQKYVSKRERKRKRRVKSVCVCVCGREIDHYFWLNSEAIAYLYVSYLYHCLYCMYIPYHTILVLLWSCSLQLLLNKGMLIPFSSVSLCLSFSLLLLSTVLYCLS